MNQNKFENQLLEKLWNIIKIKQTNLCIAADFDTLEECCKFVDEIGQDICILKTHCELFKESVNQSIQSILKRLSDLAKKHNFLLFEDRKFNDHADVSKKFYSNLYVDYCDIVTLDGPDALYDAFEQVSKEKGLVRGCFALCELSYSKLRLNPREYYEVAKRHPSFCIGVIAQTLNLDNEPFMIKACPGVHLSKSKSESGAQNWNHPTKIMQQGADILIVGRGIIAATSDQRKSLALEYKNLGFKALMERYKSD